METTIELRISCSYTMIKYRLSQKFKLLGNGKFNYFNYNSNNLHLVLASLHITFG